MFEGINMKKKSFEEIIDFDGELNIVEEFLNIDSSLIESIKSILASSILFSKLSLTDSSRIDLFKAP